MFPLMQTQCVTHGLLSINSPPSLHLPTPPTQTPLQPHKVRTPPRVVYRCRRRPPHHRPLIPHLGRPHTSPHGHLHLLPSRQYKGLSEGKVNWKPAKHVGCVGVRVDGQGDALVEQGVKVPSKPMTEGCWEVGAVKGQTYISGEEKEQMVK